MQAGRGRGRNETLLGVTFKDAELEIVVDAFSAGPLLLPSQVVPTLSNRPGMKRRNAPKHLHPDAGAATSSAANDARGGRAAGSVGRAAGTMRVPLLRQGSVKGEVDPQVRAAGSCANVSGAAGGR